MIRRSLYLSLGLLFVACSGQVQTPSPAPSPIESEPSVVTPAPFNIDGLIQQYGEPIQLGGEKTDRYVLVKVVYDANDDLQGQPEEPALANWKVAISGGWAKTQTDSTWFSNTATTNSSGGFLLQLPAGLNRDLLFRPEQPNATGGLVTWNALERSVPENPNAHLQEVFLTAGCRTAETGLVVPYPKGASEAASWPCRREPRQTQSVSGTWQTLGEGIQAGSTGKYGSDAFIEAFRIAPDGSPLLAIDSPFSDINFSITRFWKWQDAWISALPEVTGTYNSVLPTIRINPSGRFLKSTWLEDTRSYTIETATAQTWTNPIPLGPMFGDDKFNLDSQGSLLRRNPPSSSSAFEKWNGSAWVALAKHPEPASFGVTKTGQIYADSINGIDFLRGGAWVHIADALQLPPRLSKDSCRLAANTATDLLLDCTMRFRPISEIPERQGFTARALYLYRQGVWRPVLFERDSSVFGIGFDSQQRAIIAVIENNQLFVNRWKDDHWEHVGSALNDANSVTPRGYQTIRFSNAPDGTLFVAWVGLKPPAQNVYVSQLKE
jgi:hypothetical protein